MDEREFERLFGKKLLFRPAEVAAMFSMSASQIRDLVEDEVLQVVRDINGNKVKPQRILKKSILWYLKQAGPSS